MQFFYNLDLMSKGINSIFLKEEYIIAFNEEWIEQANIMEVQVTCFHESRHAFQWKCINGDHPHEINLSIIQTWKKEIGNYNQPTKKDFPEEEYLKQEIEIDAITFANYQIKNRFDLESVIPQTIKEEVNRKLDFIK